jgi:hypothetical protein
MSTERAEGTGAAAARRGSAFSSAPAGLGASRAARRRVLPRLGRAFAGGCVGRLPRLRGGGAGRVRRHLAWCHPGASRGELHADVEPNERRRPLARVGGHMRAGRGCVDRGESTLWGSRSSSDQGSAATRNAERTSTSTNGAHQPRWSRRISCRSSSVNPSTIAPMVGSPRANATTARADWTSSGVSSSARSSSASRASALSAWV